MNPGIKSDNRSRASTGNGAGGKRKPISQGQNPRALKTLRRLNQNTLVSQKFQSIFQFNYLGEVEESEGLSEQKRDQDDKALREAKTILSKNIELETLRTDTSNEMFLLKGMASRVHDYQLVATAFMWRLERARKGPHGGIIADDMGIGKTIQAITCMVLNPRPRMTGKNKYKVNGGTLIIVPSNDLAKQWKTELETHAKISSDDIFLYKDIPLSGLKAYDYIITTYGTVAAAAAGPKESKLFQLTFHRIVLDEGDKIKGQGATSKACIDLKAKNRWLLTGTPLHNRLQEAKPYFKFLGIQLNADRQDFEQDWGPLDNNSVEERTKKVFEARMLRRQKGEFFRGRRVCELEPSDVGQSQVEMTKEEQVIYNSVRTVLVSRNQNSGFSFLGILLGRLRQAVDHPYILEDCIKKTYTKSEARELRDQLDSLEEPLVYKALRDWCEHGGMKDTAALSDRDAPKSLSTGELEDGEVKDESDHEAEAEGREVPNILTQVQGSRGCDANGVEPKEAGRPDEWLTSNDAMPDAPTPSSSKVQATTRMIREWQAEAPDDKILVYGQYLDTARIMGRKLNELGVPFLYYWGSMTKEAREKAIKKFREDDGIKVMLMSLRAGNVGLNLTVANRVVIANPWWNVCAERQAFGRVKRLGQRKRTHCVRLYVPGDSSPEARMLALQERKIGLIREAVERGRKPKHLSSEDVRWLVGITDRLDDGDEGGDGDGDGDGDEDDGDEDDEDEDGNKSDDGSNEARKGDSSKTTRTGIRSTSPVT
ncbi:SNF2 family N-terminal domain-containing protein [Xylariaceae sp. FL0804]|nr:SNF2 family N-terminal domain-containing protein [Xylariaceae sp. FL0804]